MTLKLHNTLTGSIDEFIPGGTPMSKIEEYPPVTIYSCGPTVYSYAHIGNFRTFIFNDILRRYLKFRGYRVNHAMNITDVDDKTINGAAEQGISLKEYTDKFIKIFYEDLESLNIEKFEHNPRATESIKEMIDIISALEKKGIIYNKDGSVYYSISKFNTYGKLSRLEAREIKDGARCDTDEYDKDDARDFALWKAPKENEISWETPFGKGRPGWHIECSAMVRKIFGTTIDIHTGGVDLIFPHHENEIAQSEAAYEDKFSRRWMHAEHLLVNGSKMSKSAGNFYTLRDLIDKGYSPRSIRYLLISAHYRKQLNFTFEGIIQAEHALARIDNTVTKLKDIKKDRTGIQINNILQKLLSDFTESMDDDLNISKALGVLFDFIREVNTYIDKEIISSDDCTLIINALEKIDSALGVIFFNIKKSAVDESRIEKLVAERLEAKKNKDFKKSDDIRNLLLSENIILEDTKDGTRWKIKT